MFKKKNLLTISKILYLSTQIITKYFLTLSITQNIIENEQVLLLLLLMSQYIHKTDNIITIKKYIYLCNEINIKSKLNKNV